MKDKGFVLGLVTISFLNAFAGQATKSSISFAVTDMYLKPLGGADVCAWTMSGDTIRAKSSSAGRVVFSYAKNQAALALSVSKKGYAARYLDLGQADCAKGKLGDVMLPPAQPGLYGTAGNMVAAKRDFGFKKAVMVDLMIPAPCDGEYTVTDFDTLSVKEDTITLYWVPQYGRTLGENMFESKGGCFLFEVENDAPFVTYGHQGHSRGNRINVEVSTVLNAKNLENTGLVQQKVQVFTVKFPANAGKYVFYQGGGVAQDIEPHPDKDLGCFAFVITK
jgi:hypothetical protein